MEFLNLVIDFDGSAIKIRLNLFPANSSIKQPPTMSLLILDTGADTTAITREFLVKHGYGIFKKAESIKNTATGEAELLTCEINGLTLAKQFTFENLKVDVLENWKSHTVVGVIGMDILSKMTFILSHEYKKFMLTKQPVPGLAQIFT